MLGAELLTECLENDGVEFVFGLPGEETIELHRAIHSSSIRFVTVRHEQAGAFMADVYGRLTGRAGVCLSTLGPGATNLVTGVADANIDHAPLVAITAQTEQSRFHKESKQYIDTVHLFEPITKWTVRMTSTGVIPEVTRRAFKLAQAEKPGACHIEVPQDVSQFKAKAKPLGIQETQPTKAPRREIERALEVIRGSKYPLVLAGSAAVRGRASKELRRLAHRGNIPVASTFMGKGLISWRDGLSLLSVGLQMKDYVSCGLDRADVVVAAGYDFAEYPPDLWNPDGDKRIVHVDFTPAEIDSRYIPEVELVGDISSSLRALSRRVERKNVDYTKSLREFLLDELASSKNMEGVPMKPQRVMYELRRVMSRSDILVSDVGAHKLWIARLYPAYEPGTVVISNGFAAMGIALPGAIAATLIHPDRRVLAVCGDGGFMMNSQELETAKRLDAPVVAVVMRDDAYGLIEWKEESLYGNATDLGFANPDLVAYAKSFGIQGYRVEEASDLASILEEVLERREPGVVDVPVDYSENMTLTEKLGSLICPI